MFNTQAYTVGDHVTLNKDVWDKMSSKEQRALLAHEVAHSVQYKKLGFRRFMMRYGPEYAFNPDNLNGSVVKETVDKVNIVDSRYTLDQIAESFFDHVMRGP